MTTSSSKKAKHYKVSELVTPHWRRELNKIAKWNETHKKPHRHGWLNGHFRDNRVITKQCRGCGIIIPVGVKA